MSSTNLNLPTNMEDAERFQRLFVNPVVQAMETRITILIQPVLDGHKEIRQHLNAQDATIASLVRDQKKALLGWSVYATGAAAALAWGWNYIKGHIRLG